MAIPIIEYCGLRFSRIGLGCSRIGSITGATSSEAKALVETALEAGITFFDTAASYGQGDSELILSRLLASHEEALIASKIGKQVPIKAKVAKPVKAALRQITRFVPSLGGVVQRSRGSILPTNFEPSFLNHQLSGSLGRLKREVLPLMMLHSPTAETLKGGTAVDVLVQARSAGRIKLVGVSVDDLPAAMAALQDERIDAIQFPYNSAYPQFVSWLEQAGPYGKLLIAREIFGGVSEEVNRAPDSIRKNLERVLEEPSIDVALVGTARADHLSEIIRFIEEVS